MGGTIKAEGSGGVGARFARELYIGEIIYGASRRWKRHYDKKQHANNYYLKVAPHRNPLPSKQTNCGEFTPVTGIVKTEISCNPLQAFATSL
jgi:hypothetical protein